MKFKKSLLIICLIICIFAVASVSATDVNDTAIASEDTDQMELSTDDGITEDNLQANNEETVSAETDSEILIDGQYTYSNLREQIGSGGNINLTKGTYTYNNDGDTIEISTSGVINGNGAVIDMAQSGHRAFTVSSSGVTIKNLTIKNANSNGYGGAIWMVSGTVTNCNFTNNQASGDGGAIYFSSSGTVTNCNFTNNQGTGTNSWGGAIMFLGTGNVTNCNFTDNSASKGGAIYSFYWSTADTCIFKTGSDTTFNIGILPPMLNVDNFTTFYGSGEKLTFNLTTNSGIPVNNGNISISVYFKDNSSWVGNYSCLSGEGWTVDLPVGSYYAIFNTEYAGFQPINRTLTVTDGTTFWDLNQTINGNTNATITLDNDYSFNPASDSAFTDGIVINRPVTIKGNGNAIDAKRQARIFYVQSANAVLENLTIINANYNGDGGAIYFSSSATSGTVSNCNFTNNTAGDWGGAIRMYSGTVENCNFTDNSASSDGGAIWIYSGTVINCTFYNNKGTGFIPHGGAICFDGEGFVSDCNFTDNSAKVGGAVYFFDQGTVRNCNFTNNSASRDGGAVYFDSNGEVTNCNFTGNNANWGSAIYFWTTSTTKKVSNSSFLNNRANAEALEITKNDNNITITFTGQNNLLNAIYSREDAEVAFYNVTYWGVNGITTVSAALSGSNKAAGQNITVGIVVNDEIVLNQVYVTNADGTIVLNINAGENYYITARHDADSYYTEAEKTISNNINVNVTSQTTTNKTVNITAKSNIYSEFMPGKLLFILPNGTQINATYGGNGIWWAVHSFDDYGVYQINASYIGLDNVTINNATIAIKLITELTADEITTTYNINKDLVITLTDNQSNPLSGFNVTVDLNGLKTYVTDGNGQVKVPTNVLTPNVYTAKISFDGNDYYVDSSVSVKVTVNKATPKLTAKAKTFKTTTKTKKYTVTLKDNTGKAIKKAKVTLKVKGKTYKATTNSKGKATFKITKLNKKGTFKAVITYKGNKNYKKVTKKANIKVIVAFKTVSRGSKDKSTVKQIQQALKDNGYYLSYKGHYLMVDGKFNSCTERSVKEFQHDKGLKVTGKVDEKTAKKLGLI